MSVSSVSAVFVSCDEPECDQEDVFDAPVVEAVKAARAMGWAIRARHGVRCPRHRRYVRRRP